MAHSASHKQWKLYLSSVLLLMTLCLTAKRPVPELWGMHVHDDAHVLSQTSIDNLERKLKAYEDSTSNQIAILLIPSLDGDVLEEYALLVAETWKLGQKAKDNGALLLVAVNDHKMRIEVGQGLEGVLTDAVCSRIIRNKMAPSFRKDNYDEGVTAGIDAIVAAIRGEYAADPEDSSAGEELGWKEKVLLGLFVFSILGLFTVIGVLSPGRTGWFMYAFLVPFYAIFPMAIFGATGGIVAFAVYFIVYPILKLVLAKTALGQRMAKKIASSSGSGRGLATGSGWSMGGWSSDGGGGSGFSGGGGSFGGGGSSGSW